MEVIKIINEKNYFFVKFYSALSNVYKTKLYGFIELTLFIHWNHQSNSGHPRLVVDIFHVVLSISVFTDEGTHMHSPNVVWVA
jgi:hypothetical protein